ELHAILFQQFARRFAAQALRLAAHRDPFAGLRAIQSVFRQFRDFLQQLEGGLPFVGLDMRHGLAHPVVGPFVERRPLVRGVAVGLSGVGGRTGIGQLPPRRLGRTLPFSELALDEIGQRITGRFLLVFSVARGLVFLRVGILRIGFLLFGRLLVFRRFLLI